MSEDSKAQKLKINHKRNLVLTSGRAHPELAQAVAKELGIDLMPTDIFDFANQEIYVHFKESIRGTDIFVLQSHTGDLNKAIMEQLIMIDALKRASVRTINAVIPHFGYARQDKKHKGREPISAKLVFDLLKTAGATRIMTVDLHADQLQGFFDGPVDHISAMGLLLDYARGKCDLNNLVIVSPDAGRIKTSEKIAQALGGVPLAFIHKTRDINKANTVKANSVVGDVNGKEVIISDDLIDTAGTICGAVEVCMKAGAKKVMVLATHAVLSDPAAERLQNSSASEIVVTDTYAIPDEHKFEKLTVLSIAPMLANTITAVFEGASVAKVINGYKG
ncbi:MAG: ribose-phosphate diphosphokinase [Bifidobacteriaceae bacterium]|jgi:ribose-phosphate pyrophosphokinase|nr:ribose-phosphate diphosphokinase [Bifidobacteriaceae bacterium]